MRLITASATFISHRYIQRRLTLLPLAIFCGLGRPTSTQFHVESFSLLPHRLASCDTTRHARGSIYSNDYTYLSLISQGGREGGIESRRYGAERIVHGPIDALAIPEPGFTWPGDLLTLHVKYVGARPRTTKMRGGMIYNGVMGSRDDTAVIVAPRGIIA